MKNLRRTLCSLAALVLCVCLLPAAGAETSVTLSDTAVYDRGHTTFSWTVTGNEADIYYVFVSPCGNGSAEQSLWKIAETNVHSAQAVECIPGKSYEVTVTDGDYIILDRKEYTLAEAEPFADGKLTNSTIRITTEPRKALPSGSIQEINSLRASDIIAGAQNNSAYYGIRYQMRMPQLIKPRTFFVTLAFEAPNGYLFVEQATDITFDQVIDGYQTLWWNIAGADFFLNLYARNGDVPAGTYQVHMFWDGMWVNTSTFNVY